MAKKLSGVRWAVVAVVVVLVAAAATWMAVRGRAPTRPAAAPAAVLVATVRSEPRSFNRLVARDRTSHVVSLLLHGRLVRMDLASQEIEPALAERWTASQDGLEYRLSLRQGVRFSDGAPFTSADVVFSFRALYDEGVASPIADAVQVNGRRLDVSAPDPSTVVVRFPTPYGPGLRILDVVPILPRHRLGDALNQGRLREAWDLTTPASEVAGLGPFVLEAYEPGERLRFSRNPHYWRTGSDGARLPRLDRLVVAVVPDQNTEILRLESGESDVMSADVRPDDLPSVRRAAARGRLTVHELGVGLDPDFLWFNLTPGFAKAQPGQRWLQRRELRDAIAAGVDREAFAQVVYAGAAVPVGGPVTPGNRVWHDEGIRPEPLDRERARALLAAMGLRDRDGDRLLETAAGAPARFSLLTQKGNSIRERAVQFLQQELSTLGLQVDVVALEQPAVIDRVTRGEYEAAYLGMQGSDTDPATNLDFWLSSGSFHPWNPEQASPATPWEARIDALMRRQVASTDRDERKRLFDEVQRIFAEHRPAIYFVAPQVHVATSARVRNVQPALLQPPVLWAADELSVARP